MLNTKVNENVFVYISYKSTDSDSVQLALHTEISGAHLHVPDCPRDLRYGKELAALRPS